MLLSVYGASFPPVAQARNCESSLYSPPLPPPAPPSAEPVGSIFKTHVVAALLSPEPPAPPPWIAALASLWSAWRPLPLTCLLCNHQTHLANCQSGVVSPLLPPGGPPLFSTTLIPGPQQHPKAPLHSPLPAGTKCEAGPVLWTPVQCCASGHSPWRPSGRRCPGGQDRLPGVGAQPFCHPNLRLLQGCLGPLQGAECSGPRASPSGLTPCSEPVHLGL